MNAYGRDLPGGNASLRSRKTLFGRKTLKKLRCRVVRPRSCATSSADHGLNFSAWLQSSQNSSSPLPSWPFHDEHSTQTKNPGTSKHRFKTRTQLEHNGETRGRAHAHNRSAAPITYYFRPIWIFQNIAPSETLTSLPTIRLPTIRQMLKFRQSFSSSA
jgi:hypothetical protein